MYQGPDSSQQTGQPPKLPSLASLHPLSSGNSQVPQQHQHLNTSTYQPYSNYPHATHQRSSSMNNSHGHQTDDLKVTQSGSFPPTNLRRGPWSLDEDKKLMESINMFGPSNWVRISQNLGTRTPKQCRERYHQNLKPSLNRNPITPEEGQLIEELVAKHGKRWAEIARHLNGRSDNAIKNWWNGGANRRRRESVQAILDETSNPMPQQQGSQHYNQGMTQQDYGHQFKTPSFNTSMFGNAASATPQGSVHQGLGPHAQHPIPLAPAAQAHLHQPPPPVPSQQFPYHQSSYLQNQQQSLSLGQSRSSSITHDMLQQHQGVKRLLEEEQHYPLRRHSAQTILTSTAGSTSPFSSGYSRTGPDSSRNSSISIDYNLHSNSTSRRSSLVHELLPNSAKRHNSQSSASYLSPSFLSHRGSGAGIPASLTPLTAAYPPQCQDKPIFKPDFNFAKGQQGVNLPPPSSIQPNVKVQVSSVVNEDETENKDTSGTRNEAMKPDIEQRERSCTSSTVENAEEAEPQKVMNISNLLS